MLIDYQNVSIYQADKCILKDINFHIDEGEFAYLIGKVGSGKSSLLKTLYCELDLVEGETEKAEILGRDLKTIKRKEIPALRKELGIIFQDFQLLHDRTVRKNFEFVLKATKWKGKKEITQRIEEELGRPATLVVTGGLAKYVTPLCRHPLTYDPELLLKGLALLYQMNAPQPHYTAGGRRRNQNNNFRRGRRPRFQRRERREEKNKNG